LHFRSVSETDVTAMPVDEFRSLLASPAMKRRLAFIVTGAVALLVICVGAFWRGPRAAPMHNPAAGLDNNTVFYVDEVTMEESLQSPVAVPPLLGKTGKPTLVQAIYVRPVGGTNRLAYLRKYSAEGKRQLDEQLSAIPASRVPVPLVDGQLVLPKILIKEPSAVWVELDSPEGQAILQRVREQCRNDQARVITGLADH
jgi:hypothetical protein